MKAFNDGFTPFIQQKIFDWGLDRLYEIEDNIGALEENDPAIMEYLKEICCSMPLGLALRRYLCGKFGSETKKEGASGYCFTLSDGREITVSDYRRAGYDIQHDDVGEYTELFLDINRKYNSDADGNLLLNISKAEAKRLICVTTTCLRRKMFLISFALHMDSAEMKKFLTDVLAEQTYNYRQPEEIIALYCQSHENINSYGHYLRLKEKYEEMTVSDEAGTEEKPNYTVFAAAKIGSEIRTEAELLEFLAANRANFAGYSRTAYSEFSKLFQKALSGTTTQALSNDEYLVSATVATEKQRKEQTDRINRAIEIQQTKNTEQLAREMLSFIPRYTSERVKAGKKIVTNDFIPIYNGESGQSDKKVQTTMLPKDITMNLLMKDRLDDLINRLKPVERKDLVFLKFYVFSLDLIKRGGNYTTKDYRVFCEECDEMLLHCGMSRLYPANRFENLIMLSLLATNPFEMFETILEFSFMNEPASEECK